MLPPGNRMPPVETHQLDPPNLCAGELHRWYAYSSHFVWSEQSRPTQSSTKLNSPTAQHYGIRRRTGFPPKYLQRNSDTDMRSTMQQQQAGSMWPASYTLFTNLDHTAANYIRQTTAGVKTTAQL